MLSGSSRGDPVRFCIATILATAALPAAAATVDGTIEVQTTFDLPGGVVLVDTTLGDPVVTGVESDPGSTIEIGITGDALDFAFDFLLAAPQNAALGAGAPIVSASVGSAVVTASATLRNDADVAVEVPFTQTGGYTISASGDRFPGGEAFDPFRDFAGISAGVQTASGFDDGRTAFDAGEEDTGGFDVTGQAIDLTDGSFFLDPGQVTTVELVRADFTNAAVVDAPAPIPLPAGAPLLLAGLGALGLARMRRPA